MDVSLRAEELMKRDIERMSVTTVEREIEQLAKDAVEFMRPCDDEGVPRHVHPAELAVRKQQSVGMVQNQTAINLLPNGNLVITWERVVLGSTRVMKGERASVEVIHKAGFTAREAINSIYLFVEQEKIFRMCKGVKPALA